ncbi:hypothetical protein VP01_927g2, partial [Puccinia sorghi]
MIIGKNPVCSFVRIRESLVEAIQMACWKEHICKGIRLHSSTAFHPQTNGQSEIANKA